MREAKIVKKDSKSATASAGPTKEGSKSATGVKTTKEGGKPAVDAKSTENKKKSETINKWKIATFCTSGLALIFLISTVLVAAQPPATEYVYLTGSSDSSNSSTTSSSITGSSSSGSTGSSSSSTTSSSSSYSSAYKQEVVTYNPGEKIGTSAKGVTIQVNKVIKNYQGYTYYYEPDSGYEYVQVDITMKNNTGNAISLYAFDFDMEDGAGMMDDAESSHYDTSSSYFPFNKEIASGATVSGVMLFQVRKDAADNLTFLYEKDTNAKRIMISL